MALPQPKVALTDACSVIFNNTLYSYSTNAFQSLSLKMGASWTELTQGEKVTGGVCVGSTPANPSRAALFIVGGRGETPAYQGLQKFTYSTGTWEAVPAAGAATQNRTGHGAVYINSTDTILVYAGALDSSTSLSTQTFSISASSGDVLAHTSTAPPAYLPILLSWSASEAALVGGSNTNNKVMLFSIAQGWIDSGTTLAEPLQKNSTAVKAMIMDGDDGSKSLYTFDPTVSPTVVNRTVLINSVGGAVLESAPVTKRLVVEEAGLPWTARRNADQTLTLADWPAYDSTYGPSSVMDSYSLADNGDGMVVLAGDGDSVLSIFNARENGWEDASALLGGSDSSSTSTDGGQTSSSATSAAAAAAAATTTTSSSGSATAAAASKSNTNVLLWSILGSVLGATALLVIVLLLVKRRNRKRAHLEAGHSKRASGPPAGEKGGFAFAKDSLPQPLASPTLFRGHEHEESASSFSSVAVLMGRLNQQKTGTSGGLSRNPSDPSTRTSADSMFNRAFKNAISKPIPHRGGAAAGKTDTPPPRYEETETAMVDEKGGPAVTGNKIRLAPAPAPAPRPRDKADRSPDRPEGSTRRSSGWNRYWSGGPALNILGFGSDRQQNDPAVASRAVGNGRQDAIDPAQRSTIVSVGSSHYSDLPPLRPAQDSGNVMPLQAYRPRASVSRVNPASPAISHLAPQSQHSGLSGQIEMSRLSGASVASTISDGDRLGYSSGAAGAYGDLRDHAAGPDGFATPWSGSGRTAGRVPSSAYSQSVYTTGGTPPSGPVAQLPLTSASALFSQQQQRQEERLPTGVSRQPALARAETSDMSWLNLGEGTH